MPALNDYIKGLFASVETSGDIAGDYLQLTRHTFNDLKARGLVPENITWEKIQRFPALYDRVANMYIQDIMETFKIPTVEEAALWSWRPAWYQQYGGKIENIPADLEGVYGKTARQIMSQRNEALQGYLEKTKPTPQQQEKKLEQIRQQVSSIVPAQFVKYNPLTGQPAGVPPAHLTNQDPYMQARMERMKTISPYVAEIFKAQGPEVAQQQFTQLHNELIAPVRPSKLWR